MNLKILSEEVVLQTLNEEHGVRTTKPVVDLLVEQFQSYLLDKEYSNHTKRENVTDNKTHTVEYV